MLVNAVSFLPGHKSDYDLFCISQCFGESHEIEQSERQSWMLGTLDFHRRPKYHFLCQHLLENCLVIVTPASTFFYLCPKGFHDRFCQMSCWISDKDILSSTCLEILSGNKVALVWQDVCSVKPGFALVVKNDSNPSGSLLDLLLLPWNPLLSVKAWSR
jgi:hypothetical protein